MPGKGKRVLSPWQIAARRRNAGMSTGPRTPVGKRRSALNSLKGGLIPPWLERKLIIQGDDPRDSRRLHRDLMSALEAYHPDLRRLLAGLTSLWWERLQLLQIRPFGSLQRFQICKLARGLRRSLIPWSML